MERAPRMGVEASLQEVWLLALFTGGIMKELDFGF